MFSAIIDAMPLFLLPMLITLMLALPADVATRRVAAISMRR